MKTIKTISPTSRSQFNRCQSEFFFQRRMGMVTPPTSSMALGSEVHEVLEFRAKLLKGCGVNDADIPKVSLKAQRIAALGILHIPEDIDNYEIEVRIKVPCGPLNFIGKGDLGKPGLIHDWKTSSDPGRWGQTPTSLADDSQMLGYAYAFTVQEGWDPQPYTLKHVYLATRGTPMAIPVESPIVPWASVLEAWKGYIRDAHAMHALNDITNVEDVPYNLTGCSAYSGCPHRGYCPHYKRSRSITEGFANPNAASSALKKERTMSSARNSLRDSLGLTSNILPPDAAVPEVPVSPEHTKAVTSLTAFMATRDDVPVRSVKGLCAKLGASDFEAVAKDSGLTQDGANYVKLPPVADDIPVVDDDIPVVTPEAPATPKADPAPAPTDTKLEAPEQTILDYMVANGIEHTEKGVKAANKATNARKRLHKSRVDEVLAALPESPKADTTPAPVKAHSSPKGASLTKALTALGYSPEQIDRMNADSVDEALTEGITADGISILPNGKLVVVGKGKPEPKADTTPEPEPETPAIVVEEATAEDTVETTPEQEVAIDKLLETIEKNDLPPTGPDTQAPSVEDLIKQAADAKAEPVVEVLNNLPIPLLILVDCVSQNAMPLEQCLAGAIDKVQTQLKVDYYASVKFAEGEKAIVAAMAKALREHPLNVVFPTMMVSVDSSGTLGRYALPVLRLIPNAVFIQAVR